MPSGQLSPFARTNTGYPPPLPLELLVAEFEHRALGAGNHGVPVIVEVSALRGQGPLRRPD
jgi:hypothetical protein